MGDGGRVRVRQGGHSLSAGHGQGTLVLGSVLALAGVFPILRAADVITSGNVNAPMWVLAWVGGIFVVIGLFAAGIGWRGMAARRRANAQRSAHPDAPERWDYPWAGASISDDGYRRAIGGLGVAALFGVFLVPFAWWAFLPRASIWVVGFVGLFGLLWLLVAGTALLRLVRVLRFGCGRVRFAHFPLRPGEATVVQIEIPADVSMLTCVQSKLRFVEEVWEVHGAGENRSQQRVRYALWQCEAEIDPPGGMHQDAGSFAVPVALPADRPDLVTCLSGQPTRYWELEVRAKRMGLDYTGAFLLPVYGGSVGEGADGWATASGYSKCSVAGSGGRDARRSGRSRRALPPAAR